MPNWLNDAVFYEIYPQSFYDIPTATASATSRVLSKSSTM